MPPECEWRRVLDADGRVPEICADPVTALPEPFVSTVSDRGPGHARHRADTVAAVPLASICRVPGARVRAYLGIGRLADPVADSRSLRIDQQAERLVTRSRQVALLTMPDLDVAVARLAPSCPAELCRGVDEERARIGASVTTRPVFLRLSDVLADARNPCVVV